MPGDLEKRHVHIPEIITTAEDYRQTRHQWELAKSHVLTPIADFRALPPQYGLMVASVTLNPDPAIGDVYQDNVFVKGEEVAISKLGLSKLANAAGMTIRTERMDDRRIPDFWEVRATATFIGIDGTPQSLDATEEYDLRPGSARYDVIMKGPNGAKPNMLLQQRQKGLRHAESRAINAVTRLFGIKQKYTKAELAKPFVVLRVHFIPDTSIPEVALYITQRAMSGSTALYPGARQAALPAAPEPELLDTIGETAPEPEKPAGPLLIMEVKPSSGETNGRKWTVFRVSFSDGRYGGTFDTKIADRAAEARDKKLPIGSVDIDDTNPQRPNLKGFELAADDKNVALPLEMPDLSKL